MESTAVTAAMRTYLDSSYAAEMADLDRREACTRAWLQTIELARAELLAELDKLAEQRARMKGELN